MVCVLPNPFSKSFTSPSLTISLILIGSHKWQHFSLTHKTFPPDDYLSLFICRWAPTSIRGNVRLLPLICLTPSGIISKFVKKGQIELKEGSGNNVMNEGNYGRSFVRPCLQHHFKVCSSQRRSLYATPIIQQFHFLNISENKGMKATFTMVLCMYMVRW